MIKKMGKALHICHSLAMGGITKFIVALLKTNGKDDLQHDIMVFMTNHYCNDLPCEIHDISHRNGKIGKMILAKKIYADYEALFIHALHPSICLPLVFNSSRNQIYVFQHGLTLGNSFFKREIKRSWYNFFILRSGASVVASTRFAVEKSKELGIRVPKEQIQVIPFGVDTSSFYRRPPVIEDRRHLTVGMAGRLVRQKRFDIVISSFKDYEGPISFTIKVAGDGPERERLQNIAACLRKNTVQLEFLGDVEDMQSFYRSLDLFFLPSKAESFGLVVLEALLSGVPVAVFKDVGGCRQIIQNRKTGFIFENRSKLSAFWMELAENPKILSNIMKSISRQDYDEYDIARTRQRLHKLVRRM